MSGPATVIGGIVVPSTSPVFLGLVAAHILLALMAVVCGVVAMLSRKGRGQHPWFGTIYYWTLAASFGISLILAGMRAREDYPLVIVGMLALAAGRSDEKRGGNSGAPGYRFTLAAWPVLTS